jgi:hypothetical protein
MCPFSVSCAFVGVNVVDGLVESNEIDCLKYIYFCSKSAQKMYIQYFVPEFIVS